jgi:flagellar operon protein
MSASNAVKINNYTRPVDLLDIASRGKTGVKTSGSDKATFKDMFSAELAGTNDIKFSKHAAQRLHSRGIELSNEKLSEIATAIDKAGAKGSRETLILTDEAALIVSVENRTVITAFDRDNLREGVVTSIDSAVIL